PLRGSGIVEGGEQPDHRLGPLERRAKEAQARRVGPDRARRRVERLRQLTEPPRRGEGPGETREQPNDFRTALRGGADPAAGEGPDPAGEIVLRRTGELAGQVLEGARRRRAAAGRLQFLGPESGTDLLPEQCGVARSERRGGGMAA